jgi:hypothetical protein
MLFLSSRADPMPAVLLARWATKTFRKPRGHAP